jgi:hypothetical protein
LQKAGLGGNSGAHTKFPSSSKLVWIGIATYHSGFTFGHRVDDSSDSSVFGSWGFVSNPIVPYSRCTRRKSGLRPGYGKQRSITATAPQQGQPPRSGRTRPAGEQCLSTATVRFLPPTRTTMQQRERRRAIGRTASGARGVSRGAGGPISRLRQSVVPGQWSVKMAALRALGFAGRRRFERQCDRRRAAP